MTKLLAMFAVLALPLAAQDNRAWRWSVVSYSGAQVADITTSWGKLERNPLLQSPNGRCLSRAVGFKVSITSVVVIGEWLIIRKRPSLRKVATWLNFGLAGAVTGVAVYNVSNHR